MAITVAQWQTVIDGASKKAARGAGIAVRKAGRETVRIARELVPVDTGFLRASIVLTPTIESGGFAEGGAEAQAFYSGYVEFGTSRQAPQPYMRPAAALATQNLVSDAQFIGVEALLSNGRETSP